MGYASKEWLDKHVQVSIPRKAHTWLTKRAGQIQNETGQRMAIGDVILLLIEAMEQYDEENQVVFK
jgi:3-deoxy-D-manno-octulosonate 8-phosphate phosphatase KdsC-like HAD superfamily phosphatase